MQLRSFDEAETVKGVLLDGGKHLPADLVMLGVGVTPATSFV